jgi:hypothetical protein
MINWVDASALESQPEGARVGFRKHLKLKHLRAVAEMATFADVDFSQDQAGALDAFARIDEVMSQVVLDWTLVDEDGEPLPKPKDNPQAFEELTFPELMWIVEKMGEAVGAKN